MSDDLSASGSFIDAPSASSQPSIIDIPSNNAEEMDSLPSSPTTDDSLSVSDDDEYAQAEREWKESLQQLELLLSMVIVPYLGKYFGRKFAYYGWKRFMEWKYPVEIVVTNSARFKAVGAVEAAASL
ncbi:uncharacterized protein HMPREF1541_03452 [Cyphellophora europaea CBS 101466]|uniref:Uncharacterized protein n=1 Tax=Cyphellophora europaea (strain CBS 101466) TaxID=1220924 RepID=W2RYE4_CYPE1|nr:uncharacterized protein HMPREF1541_03452 [Cyphellophora europaea CBS 101466]ETN41516.1 hypothetical protein HMPREF1541_03452 [Cyphellophora europaea CBS 101466]